MLVLTFPLLKYQLVHNCAQKHTKKVSYWAVDFSYVKLAFVIEPWNQQLLSLPNKYIDPYHSLDLNNQLPTQFLLHLFSFLLRETGFQSKIIL